MQSRQPAHILCGPRSISVNWMEGIIDRMMCMSCMRFRCHSDLRLLHISPTHSKSDAYNWACDSNAIATSLLFFGEKRKTGHSRRFRRVSNLDHIKIGKDFEANFPEIFSER